MMFGKRKKKEKPSTLSYQIVGHSGIRDGGVVAPRENFTRSWTVLNSAPASSKEKGRVVKMVHSHGIELKQQLLFLWPVPGKLVTFSLDLAAPDEPGHYESYWTIEGAEQTNEFWVKFKVENPKSQLVNSISVPSSMNALSLSQIKKETNSPRGISPRSLKNMREEAEAKAKSANSSRRRRKKGRLLSNTNQDVTKSHEVHKTNSGRAGTPIQTENSRPRRSSSLGEASPLVRLMSGDSVSVMSNLFITDILQIEPENALLPTIADMSGTTLDGLSLKEEVEEATIEDTNPFLRAKSLGAVSLEPEKPELRLSQTYPAPEDDLIEDENGSSTESKSDIKPRKKKPRKTRPSSGGNYRKRKSRSRTNSENKKSDNTNSIETNNGIINDQQAEQLEGKEEKNFSASGIEVGILDIPQDEYTLPEINSGRVPRLVERWQETITSQSSKGLTVLQLTKQRKLNEVSLSMVDVKQRLIREERLPVIGKKKMSLSGDFDDEEALASSRRLHEFIKGTPRNNHMSLIQAQRSIQSYLDMAQRLEEQLSLLPLKYPEQTNLHMSIRQALQGIEDAFPVLQQAKEQIHRTQQRLEGNSEVGGLPDWIWKRIFSFLPLQDLGRVNSVCRDWHLFAQDDSLWQSQSMKMNVSDEKPFNNIVSEFSYKQIYKIEYLYGNWFQPTTKWKKEDSAALDEFSFNWPVYDLEIVDSTLVTVSDCLRVFDLARNKTKAVLPGHNKVVNSVIMTKNGKACITGSVDKTMKIWSLVTKDCWHTLEGHGGPITDITQTPNLIASSCVVDKTVRFWQKKTGQCVSTLNYENPVSCLAINLTEDNGMVYFGHVNGFVTTYDISAQQEVQSVKVSKRSIEGLQVFGNQCFASDFSQIYVQDFKSDTPSCVSPVMTRNVGKLQYDGYKLGAQIGNRLQVFDLRYLFSDYSQVTVDNLWKGAFQFHEDYVFIGGGNGKTNKWFPT